MLGTTDTDLLPAPSAVAAALWLDGWLSGRTGSDDLLGALARIAPDSPQAALVDGRSGGLGELLARIRSDGVVHAWPALPRPGRPVGWPAGVALAPRPAVLLVAAPPARRGLPSARALLHAGPGGWAVEPIAGDAGALVTAPLLAEAVTPRAAARRFAELVARATDDLARLGLERAASADGRQAWSRALRALPRGLPGQLAHILDRLCTVLDGLELALLDDGAAVTAAEARARADSLRTLHAGLTDLVAAVAVGSATDAAADAASGPQ
jgi:hypothetical protein